MEREPKQPGWIILHIVMTCDGVGRCIIFIRCSLLWSNRYMGKVQYQILSIYLYFGEMRGGGRRERGMWGMRVGAGIEGGMVRKLTIFKRGK